jgi:ABC-type oligopeptide transport system ATPase subunit
MPLAPMGCAVQVHKKSDTRGTWAYHLVDGWYLSTSPGHYQTHMCHIKSTQSDQLSNTVHYKHKNITNPVLTHADKIMKAIADLANVLKRKPIVTAKQEQEIQDLQYLMETHTHANATPEIDKFTRQASTSEGANQSNTSKGADLAISPRVPEATQNEGKQITQSTSHLPVATDQQATQRSQRHTIQR